jgi:hypothetical protein
VISTLVTLVPTLKDAAADVLRVVHDLLHPIARTW